MRAVALDMRDGSLDAVDHAGGQDGIEVFGAPIGLACRLHPAIDGLNRGIAANLATGVEQHGHQRLEELCGAGAIDQQGLAAPQTPVRRSWH